VMNRPENNTHVRCNPFMSSLMALVSLASFICGTLSPVRLASLTMQLPATRRQSHGMVISFVALREGAALAPVPAAVVVAAVVGLSSSPAPAAVAAAALLMLTRSPGSNSLDVKSNHSPPL
jgi:hypothetical protein